MRLFIVIALCLAVASATYTNRNRFNRLLRNLQRQQPYNQQYESQGLSYEQDYDQDDDNEQQQEDDDDYYQQQQCSRRGNRLDLNDDEDEQSTYGQEYDEQDDDQESGIYGQRHQYRQHQHQQQGGRRQHQQYGPQSQQKRQQQQRHQCQPKYQLLQELEEPNCKLASKLYKQAKQENDDKNTVVSPAAVQLALAAIQRGARGHTKRQLQRVLGEQLSPKQQQQAVAALQQTLQGQQQGQRQQQYRGQQNQQGQVKTTTTIIINQHTRTQQKFIQAVKACQNAQVKQCNFQRQPQQCRQQINQYIAQKTNQKLQQVVPQQAITENTKMIVVNTAQLKARWGQQFRQQQQTKQGKFYPLGTQQPKHVQVLQSQGQFNYYEDEQLQIVGVPTQRQELTLYVIVPKDKDGLTEIEKQQIQNGQQLKQLLDQAEQQQQEIDLELPKFQIKHKIDAKQTLRQQGVQAPFDADEADLSGINGQRGQQGQGQQQHRRRRQQQLVDDEDDQQSQYGQYEDEQERGQQQGQQLHVNKLIHQATIKIDEQGISAARPGRQQEHRQYQPEQDQDQYDSQEDDEDDDEDQEDKYERQQFRRQQLYRDIFGQNQNQRRHHQRRNQQNGGERKVKVNRAFAFAVKHNPSNQIVMVGRVVDATQKPKHQPQQPYGRQQGQQSLNGVDQQ